MIEDIAMSEAETQTEEQCKSWEDVEACFPALYGTLAFECLLRDPEQMLLNFHQYYI